MPTRGFGDFYYKQKKGGDGNLLPSEKQVKLWRRFVTRGRGVMAWGCYPPCSLAVVFYLERIWGYPVGTAEKDQILIGEFLANQVVSACPEVVVHERGSSGDEELLLLACDGVWDVFENQDAGEFFISQLERPVGKVGGCLLQRLSDR